MRCFAIAFCFLALTCYWAWQLVLQSPSAVLPVDGMSPVPLSALLLLGASLLTYLFVYREDARMASWAARRRYLVLIGVCMAGGRRPKGCRLWRLGRPERFSATGIGGYGRRRGPLRGGGRSRVRPTGPSSCPAAGRGEHFSRGSVASRGRRSLLGAATLCFWLWPALAAVVFLRGARRPFPKKRFYAWMGREKVRFPVKLALTCFVQGVALEAHVAAKW